MNSTFGQPFDPIAYPFFSSQGHSYEVDVWSLGVVIYTLLIGKPPFETSDVRSTYRRIRSNAYYFPEGHPLSDAATDLIRKILRTEPEARPTLAEMLKHPFFTRFNGHPSDNTAPAYTKPSPAPVSRLPSDARQSALQDGKDGTPDGGVMHINVWAGGESSLRVRQGTDPRLQPPASLQIPSTPSGGDLLGGPKPSTPSQRGAVSSSPMPPAPGSAQRLLAARGLEREGSGQLGDSNIETMSHYTMSTMSPSAMTSMSRGGSSGTFGGLSRTTSANVSESTRTSSGLRTQYRSPAGTPTARGLLGSQLSGFGGSRTSSMGDGSGSGSGPVTPHAWGHQESAWEQRPAAESQSLAAARANQSNGVPGAAEQLRALRLPSKAESVLSTIESEASYPQAVKADNAAAEKEPTVTVSVRCDSALLASMKDQGAGQVRKVPELKSSARPPRADSAPSPATAEKGLDRPQEGAVSKLYRSLSAGEQTAAGQAASSNADSSLDAQQPSVWVTRWVDYSSKYGMGYVLSNGAVGVLFNDATKVSWRCRPMS